MSLRNLYTVYGGKVKFIVIYIREAHPQDGWSMNRLNQIDNKVDDPKTIVERRQLAGRCRLAMQHGIQTYVDKMHDPVMTAYAAHPERLYLIDDNQIVVYQSGLGPLGFKPAQLRSAIEMLLREDLSEPDAPGQ